MKRKEMLRHILNSNYSLIREGKHTLFKHNVTKATLALPRHNGPDLNSHLTAGLLKQIKRDNGELK